MPAYFELSPEDQLAVLGAVSEFHGISRELAEKDVWICWALATLFRLPGALPSAFKGGTSLSKVFDAIRRVSEDIDISVDIRSLCGIPDDFASLNGSQLKKIRERVEAALKGYTGGQVLPWMEAQATAQFGEGLVQIELDDRGEGMRIRYPSAIPAPGRYLREGILLEFGGRNITIPSEQHRVVPYACELGFEKVDFPEANVTVLSPMRTFWEKATLIHLECQKKREPGKGNSERQVRHWYDLAQLADHEIGKKAIPDRALAESVVIHKGAFFRDPAANYPACLSGGLILIPSDHRLEELKDDFRRMVDASMFYGGEPDFRRIMERISDLQQEINELMRK